MNQTHPLICDSNCTFFASKVDDAGKAYLYCNKAKCNIHYSWRMMAAVNGCASHSDFQNERNKVIDEVIDDCYAIVISAIDNEGGVSVETIHRKFVEFQQNKQGDERND